MSIIVATLCGFLAIEVSAAGVASWYIRQDQPARALSLLPRSAVALGQRADELLADGRNAEANAVARQAVSQSPMAASSLRMLALTTSDMDGRRRLMRQAGRLSLRDRQSQMWLMNDAVRNGDIAASAFHADMLLRRQGVNQSAVFLTLMGLLDREAGRRAVAARLRLRPFWRGEFLRKAGKYGVPQDVGGLLMNLGVSFSDFDDRELDPYFSRLIADGRYADARYYWLRLTKNDRGTLVYDSQFDGLPGPPPLNWATLKSDGGRGVLGVKDGVPAGMLRLQYDGIAVPSAFAKEIVLLRPGAYRIVSRLGPVDPSAVDRFRVKVDCGRDRVLIEVPLGKQREMASAPFTVPPDCPAQTVSFWPVAGERREDLELDVDSVAIRVAYGQ